MVEVWMGCRPLRDAMAAGEVVVEGAPVLAKDPLRWIGQSPLARISQQPSDRRVGRILDKIRA